MISLAKQAMPRVYGDEQRKVSRKILETLSEQIEAIYLSAFEDLKNHGLN